MGGCRLGWEGCRAQPGLPIPSPLQPPCPVPPEGFKGKLLKGAGDVISLYTPTTDKPQTPSPPGRRLEGRLPATGPSLPAHFTFYPGHGSEFRGREAASRREYQCSPAAQRTNSIFISIFLLLWVRCWGFFSLYCLSPPSSVPTNGDIYGTRQTGRLCPASLRGYQGTLVALVPLQGGQQPGMAKELQWSGRGWSNPLKKNPNKPKPPDFAKLSLPEECMELGAHPRDEPDIADGRMTGRARRGPQHQI